MKYLVLLCAAMATVSASADPGRAERVIDLRAVDTDNDRAVSLAEAQVAAPQLAARFSEIDKNQDGFLSREEIVQGNAMPMRFKIVRGIEKEFAKADSDADGRISQTEALGMPIVNEFFADMDSSADGFVTMDEIREHAKSRGPILKRVSLERGAIGIAP